MNETTDLRRLAEAARDSLARDGTSWWDAMRYIASDEEQDFATLCSPDRILALLAERDALLAEVGRLDRERADAFARGRERERNTIRAAVEAQLLATILGPTDEPGMCECGQDMDAHAGGFALLHHDEVIVAAERARIAEAVNRIPPGEFVRAAVLAAIGADR